MESRLRRLVADGAGMDAITLQTVALWREAGQALVPIIGQRGMSALYERALHLTAPRYGWLGHVADTGGDAPAFSALVRAMSLRTEDDAIAAVTELFATFERLLATLIGAPLTERLLQPTRDGIPSGPIRQDPAT